MSSEVTKEPDEKVKALVIERYGNRYFALYEGETLICVTVYRKGAVEVKRRLEATQNLIQKQTECLT
ncbi:MAG: hypothetical protein ABSB10_02695 [Candidatus Bathyarchaeia archaeon]|jgi:hypothetical protein